MPPKFDPSQVTEVYVRMTGGEVGAVSSLAPKICPLKSPGYDSAAALVIKALKEPERDCKKVNKHNGNIALDDVIEIARLMQLRSMAKEILGTIKEILGTCVSIGCTVDGKHPKDMRTEIDKGLVNMVTA
ncbi:hypothetical protein LUZ60_008908 [Juncus effusus]|nr:hypothetical protein LUZ60_008908 [Juncus effusus]